MDTKDWILFIGPLIGVVVGGLISTSIKFLELRHERRSERERLELQKLEHLSDMLSEFTRGATLFGYQVTKLISRRVTDQEARESLPEVLREYTEQMGRIGFRIRLYAPECHTSWVRTMAVIDDLEKFIGDFVKVQREIGTGPAHLQNFAVFAEKLQAVAAAALEIEVNISTKVRKLLGDQSSEFR